MYKRVGEHSDVITDNGDRYLVLIRGEGKLMASWQVVRSPSQSASNPGYDVRRLLRGPNTVRALITAVVCLAALSSVASADDFTSPPTPIVPYESGTDATQQSGSFVCTSWTPVQATPSGYVIGNCANGWHLHRTWRSAEYLGHYWDGGYIYGDYNGCGWVDWAGDQLVADGSFTACASSASHDLAEYSAGTNDANCAGGCTDGTSIANPRSCPEYANFRPWSSGQNPVNPIRTIGATSGQLKWRYITRYSAANGTGQYVMARDTVPASGAPNWVFVPRTCLGI